MKNLLKNSLVILLVFFSITILTISCEMESVAQNPTTYTLPIATSTRLGGVIVGSGLSITPDGLISSTIDPAKFTIPLATNAVVGGVKVGSGLAVTADGTLSTKNLDVLVFSKEDDKYNEFWTANIDGTNQKKISYEIVARREGDLPAYYAKPDFAKKNLHWEAKRSIELMCESAWKSKESHSV